jgi:hypothetical protein
METMDEVRRQVGVTYPGEEARVGGQLGGSATGPHFTRGG